MYYLYKKINRMYLYLKRSQIPYANVQLIKIFIACKQKDSSADLPSVDWQLHPMLLNFLTNSQTKFTQLE